MTSNGVSPLQLSSHSPGGFHGVPPLQVSPGSSPRGSPPDPNTVQLVVPNEIPPKRCPDIIVITSERHMDNPNNPNNPEEKISDDNPRGDGLKITVHGRWQQGKYDFLKENLTTACLTNVQLTSFKKFLADMAAANPKGPLDSSSDSDEGLRVGTGSLYKLPFENELKLLDIPKVELGDTVSGNVKLCVALALLEFDDLKAAILVAGIVNLYYGTQRFRETLSEDNFWLKVVNCCLDHSVSDHCMVIWVLLKCLKYYLHVTFNETTLTNANLEKLLEHTLFSKPAEAKTAEEKTVTPMGSVLNSPFDGRPLLMLHIGGFHWTIPLGDVPPDTMLSFTFQDCGCSSNDVASEPITLPGIGDVRKEDCKGLYNLLRRMIPRSTLDQKAVETFCCQYPEVLITLLSHQYLRPSERDQLLKTIQWVLSVYVSHTNKSDSMPGLLRLAHFLVKSNLEPFKWTESGFSNFLQLLACYPVCWPQVHDFLQDFIKLHTKLLKSAEPVASNQDGKQDEPLEQPSTNLKRKLKSGVQPSNKRPKPDLAAKARDVMRSGQLTALTTTNMRTVWKLKGKSIE